MRDAVVSRKPRGNRTGKGTDMRVYSVLLGVGLSIVGSIAAHEEASSQEYRGTLEQQLACTPDVFRLCGEQIPDTNRIVACLRQNTPQLSRPCRAVFESNASAPAQPMPPGQAMPGRRYGQPPSDDDQ
jgi:hypothetical protein